MIEINRIAAIAVRDYYGRMAELSKDRSYWYGVGSLSLGYTRTDPVNPDDLYVLCSLGKKAAKGIESGQKLSFVINDIEDHQAGLERPRQNGYDLTFRADKSAGIAYLGHPEQAAREAVGLSHYLAVNTTLRFFEQVAGWGRVTKDGEVSLVKAELVEAVFTHFTNRNLEPLLHSHVIVPNVVRCEDGQWRALHADELYRWYMAGGAIYRATFREHMRRLTNAEFDIRDGWKSLIVGLADWKGPDGANLLEAFSRRTQEVNEARERFEAESPTGTISPELRKKLGVMTRKAKDFGDARIDEIAEELRETLKNVWKLGDKEWKAIFEAYPEPHPDEFVSGLWLAIPKHLEAYGPVPAIASVESLVSYMSKVLFDEGGRYRKEGALSGKAYVSVQDIHRVAYDLFGGFVASDALSEAISGLLSGKGPEEKLTLVPLAPAVRVKGKKAPLSKLPIRYYATRAVLNSEAAVLEMAARKTAAAHLDEETVNRYLAAEAEEQKKKGGFVLSLEQQDALRHLFSSRTSATLLMGAQGAGKTTMFSHFAKLARANDIAVWGIAPTGTAAQKLGDTLRRVDSNAQSLTIESFVGQVLSGSVSLPENLCVILDESSQADTLELAEALDVITKAGAKLILVGDDRQLGSVRYGGMFATLFAKLGGARLTETRRAAGAWDRTAQSHLRMGDLKEALRIYEQAKRITVCDDNRSLVESIGGWLKSEFEFGSDAFVITGSTREEMMANLLAHQRWDRHRMEWVESYLDAEVRHHRLSAEVAEKRMARLSNRGCRFGVTYRGDGLVFRPGDLAAVRRSIKLENKTWLQNGTRARILDITEKSVVLLVQDDSSARRVKVSRAFLSEHPGCLSYGWASTVYRTQSMELGNAEREVAVADVPEAIVPDTPVRVKKTTFRSKSIAAEFLEDKGDKITIRLANGKIRTVAKSRVFLDSETQRHIENLIVNARDGNALVVGTEGMNLDSLLVASSRARQRTDFFFRSVRDTESDYMSEKLLGSAPHEELARATLALYVARQSQPEQPDSAYLRLAREREATTLAATVDLDVLNALRLWLSDHLTSGTLDVSIDKELATSAREAAEARLKRLGKELASASSPDLKAHLATEIDACAAEIGYTERELARLEVFAEFIGHAEGSLSDKEGRVVIDERYVKDRISLVDEAIAMAEDVNSWIEVKEIIEVPLPENTAREVVDVSSKEQTDLDKRAKLFSCLNYQVASDWMNLAEAVYEKALTENLDPAQAIESVDLPDEDRPRLREAFTAVAVNRAHPTPVSHPVTLRTMREEALEDEVDADLVAAVERMTESLSERENRHSERRYEDQVVSSLFSEEEEDLWDDTPDLQTNDKNLRATNDSSWVPGEAEPELEDSYFEDYEDDIYSEPEPRRTVRVPGSANGEQQVEYRGGFVYDGTTYEGFFHRDESGAWVVDYSRRLVLKNAFLAKHPFGDDSAFEIMFAREIEPGSGEYYDPKLDKKMVERRAREEAEEEALREEYLRQGRGPYHPDGGSQGESRGRGQGYSYDNK
jgi:conjugative relaxase-like TrwC/TraI family protein